MYRASWLARRGTAVRAAGMRKSWKVLEITEEGGWCLDDCHWKTEMNALLLLDHNEDFELCLRGLWNLLIYVTKFFVKFADSFMLCFTSLIVLNFFFVLFCLGIFLLQPELCVQIS